MCVVGGTSCSTLFLDVGFVDLGVGIVSLLSVHIEEEVVLRIGCRCDVDVGPTQLSDLVDLGSSLANNSSNHLVGNIHFMTAAILS